MSKLKNYSFVICVTMVLTVLICVHYYKDSKKNIIDNWDFTDQQIQEYGPFWITVPAAENEGLPTDINGIQFGEEPNVIYLILPKSVNTDKLVYYIRDGYESQYEARRVANFDNGDVEIAGKRLELVNTDVPIMFINTSDEGMSFSEFCDTDDRDATCEGRVFLEDSLGKNGVDMYLKPRGNFTWEATHKKPFTLVLEDSKSLLGMPSARKWNLISDVYDKSCLKNYTFYNLARDLGVEYEPEAEHIGLYINGSFEGVYLLTEKVSVDRKRVNLGEDDWFFNWGGMSPEQIIKYESESWFEDSDDIDYPYVDLLYPQNDTQDGLNAKQAYIQRYIDAIEDESSTEYLDCLDIDSFAKFYWIQEASMNVDCCYRSIYTCYKNDTGKLYYCPIWDMDLTLGAGFSKPTKDGERIQFSDIEGWKVRELAYYHELFEHAEFREAMCIAYFEDGIREALWNAVNSFEGEENRIKSLGDIEYRMYRDEDSLWTLADTYEEHSQIVLDRYIARLKWIDEQMESERLNLTNQ